jgi:hypothetical protein
MQPPEDAQTTGSCQGLHRVRERPRELGVQLGGLVLVFTVGHEYQHS